MQSSGKLDIPYFQTAKHILCYIKGTLDFKHVLECYEKDTFDSV